MTVVPEVHEDLGATFGTVGGRRVALHYGRPEREHLAVRRVVGLTEPAYGVVVVRGPGRVAALDRALTAVPRTEGDGVYALCRDEDGRILTDARVHHAGERVLCFTPPDRTGHLRDALSRPDVAVREATDEFSVFGIHGVEATEKVASVLHGTGTPEERLTFVRGRLGDVGVTVIRTDAPAGETGYEVVCTTGGAGEAYDVLLNQGLNAAPFGYRSWETLTVEAATPLFDPDLQGLSPDAGRDSDGTGGAERNRHRHLVGLAPDRVPPAGATVAADEPVGRVTRAVESPVLEEPIAFAAVDRSVARREFAVRTDEGAMDATRRELPFVEGSERSGRIGSTGGLTEMRPDANNSDI